MRIGFIAMNGIRASDPAVQGRLARIQSLAPRLAALASLPSLPLLTLAGMTPPEHAVTYLEVPSLEAIAGLPTTDDPPGAFDLVAISSYSAQIKDAYELADRYRKTGTRVVIGGPHVSFQTAEAAAHADAVIVGEGEPVWAEILSDCAGDRLKKVYGDLNLTCDLSESPMPAFELLNRKRPGRIPIQTSRGCPHRCEFCAASVLLSRTYRQKPLERVLAELEQVTSLWRHPFIEFVDDNALVDKSYWRLLLEQLQRYKLRWFAETDVAVADDLDFLELMRASGCRELLIGLESPTQGQLDGLELRNNWKHRSWYRYKDAIGTIQRQGIRVIGCFILGLDGQTKDSAKEIFDFARELELYDVQVTVLTAFPGTPLYQRLKAEGRLLEPESWERCTLFDVNHRPSHMDAEELQESFLQLLERIHRGDLCRWRQMKFKDKLRARAKSCAASTCSGAYSHLP